MIRVANKRTHTPTKQDITVGRGTPLGNPWDWRGSQKALYVCKSRDEAIANYRDWLYKQIADKNEEVLAYLRIIYRMARAGDVNLVCYCFPESCHASIIKEFIETKLNEATSSHKR